MIAICRAARRLCIFGSTPTRVRITRDGHRCATIILTDERVWEAERSDERVDYYVACSATTRSGTLNDILTELRDGRMAVRDAAGNDIKAKRVINTLLRRCVDPAIAAL